MKIGDRVHLVMAEDIEVMITGISTHQSGSEYHIAWIDKGERKDAWVQRCEIERETE